MGESIEIVVDTKGVATVAAKGVLGSSCTDFTKGIESALGTVTADKKTGEYTAQAKRVIKQ